MNIETNEPLVSPVFASELVRYARLDSDDPMIDTVLLSATSAVFSFLKQDLTTRTWTLTYKDWPIEGTTSTASSISRQNYAYRQRIELPYANLVSVESVTVNGEIVTDYQVIKGKPYMVEFDTIGYTQDDNDALVVTYKAGFGDSTADVPQAIRNAIMMTASYIHAHNGACDYTDALNASGAKQLLIPYAAKAGIVI